ncbi:MAG TPA: L-histidine N(alpha)-methyltransferase [Xanthomonadaceae bacterium]|nr:L-histidine N(alpha)-methyltransferase [Xanthomonadaceae bacterium]
MNAQPTIIDLAPELADMRKVVLTGLATVPKCLPAWLFYDAEGSRLFEAICEQPEYYPTRTELGILQRHGREIAAALGEGCRLVELGSGSHRKARALLRVLRQPDGYVAIDISGAQLREAVRTLARDFPHIPMTGIVADYGEDAALPLEDSPGDGPLVGFFPGSTIGNMAPCDAEAFLAAWAERLRGGGMLVGVDLVKDEAVLNAAYNDAAGVTAAFNCNMLEHINRALEGNFDPDRFRHHAFFNPLASRIEMHLVSETHQAVTVAGQRFDFRQGESIHSESSYKYSVPGFQSLARSAGFRPAQVWTDEREWFSVHYLAAPA